MARADRDELGLKSDTGIDVRVEDGRLGVGRLAAGGQDLIVGDAFGGVSVPWHLTTAEAIADVRTALNTTGIYVANLIDYGELSFLRAEIATLSQAFDHILLAGEPRDLGLDLTAAPDGGNFVVAASHRALDSDAIQTGLDARETPWKVMQGEALRQWVGDATPLSDNYAPVDQLLEPSRTRSTG